MSERTKKCKYCQTDIPLKAKICPNCNKDLRSWFIRHPILTFLIFIYFLGVFVSKNIDNNIEDKPIKEISQNNVNGKSVNTIKHSTNINMKLSMLDGVISEWEKGGYKIVGNIPKSEYIDTIFYKLSTMKDMVKYLGNCNKYSGDIKNKCLKLKVRATKLFPKVFPYLRSKYGEGLDQKLWDYNIDVYVTGPYKDNITFVGGYFLLNKNKKRYFK